jgi:hypothetical protein
MSDPQERELYRLLSEKAEADAAFWAAARAKLAKTAEMQDDADLAHLLRHVAGCAAKLVDDLRPLVKLVRVTQGCTTRQAAFFIGGIDLSLALTAGEDDA